MWIDPPFLSFHSPLPYFSLTLSDFLLFYLLHPFLYFFPQLLPSLLTYSIPSARHFPIPYFHLSLITSPVIHSLPFPPFSHHVFSSLSSDIATLRTYDYTSWEYPCVFGYISLFTYAYLCVFFYIRVLWYFSVHSSIKKNQHWVVFGSFRYLG